MKELIGAHDMLGALCAAGPEPSLRSELSLFGQFAGVWDLDIAFWPRDEPAWSTGGLWLFDWILDGRGIQDVILHTTRGGHIGRGTTVRIYDPAERNWKIAFLGPLSRTYVLLTARAEGDSILIEGTERGELLRWFFSEITTDSFLWRGHVSGDRGATWHYEQQMVARRRA
jgi:hypothetical protein